MKVEHLDTTKFGNNFHKFSYGAYHHGPINTPVAVAQQLMTMPYYDGRNRVKFKLDSCIVWNAHNTVFV